MATDDPHPDGGHPGDARPDGGHPGDAHPDGGHTGDALPDGGHPGDPGGLDWVGESGSVSQTRGLVFKLACLGAVSLALLSVFVLLLYVAADAFRPFSADLGWHATYGLTVLVPVLGTSLYYYTREDAAGSVALATVGIPVVGLLLAAAFAVVLSIQLVTVFELFAFELATLVAVATIVLHGRYRPQAALERLLVFVAAPVVAIFGVLPTEVNRVLNWLLLELDAPVIPLRIISLRELIMLSPIRPLSWILLLIAVTLPVGAALAWLYVERSDDRRAGGLVLLGTLAIAALGPFAGPLVGIDATVWILVATFSVAPLAVYVADVRRRGDGTTGLAFPVILVGGVLVGMTAVDALAFSGPETWLDWQFLTSVHSRNPEEAGFYPPIVGSVMLLIVVALAAFPVGVGAAIYLEEYAPESGLTGKIVTLIEINIGNLAGVPSVVYGLLALALFIRFLSMPAGSVIVGGLAVGLLILPIVIIAAQEAIRAVPDTQREASYGMGATRWQTTRNVVLPEALPGILTGTILAVGRAIGETAPLLMIGAAASVRLAPNSFYDQLPAMPRQIFSWSTNLNPEIRHGVLAAGVVTLLVILLVMNGTAIIVRNKFQRES